jgi:hypothetical protein
LLQEVERQKEMEEAARISRQREMDRRQAEEKAKQIAKEKAAKRNFGVFVLSGFILIAVFIVTGYMWLQQQQQKYIKNLIALSSVVDLNSACNNACPDSQSYIVIQKIEFNKNYLYVYFDGYSYEYSLPVVHKGNGAILKGTIKKAGPGIFDGGSYDWIFSHEDFLTVNEDKHKTGYVRFNVKDIQPSALYEFCYTPSYQCVELFTAPTK